MKWVIVLIMLAIGAGCFFMWSGARGAKPQARLQIAFGAPDDGKTVMEIIITSLMAMGDSGNHEQRWIDQHVELLDDAGQRVRVCYLNQNTLPSLNASRGSSDVGFMQAVLVPGATYRLRYRPKLGDQWFERVLDAPREAVSAQVVTLSQGGD